MFIFLKSLKWGKELVQILGFDAFSGITYLEGDTALVMALAQKLYRESDTAILSILDGIGEKIYNDLFYLAGVFCCLGIQTDEESLGADSSSLKSSDIHHIAASATSV